MSDSEIEQSRMFVGLDWSNRDLSGQDFNNVCFKQMNFSGTNFRGADLTNSLCRDCQFIQADLSDCQLIGADLSGCDLSGSLMKGANFYRAILEEANLTAVQADKETRFFAQHCPESGPFVAYKKCFDDRLVQLLIPAGAQRTSATDYSCRCEYAKVLTIKSIDASQGYQEAVSYADERFIYQVGQVMYAEQFNPNRWADSTGGIHFFMTRQEAIDYL